jgi:predicted class III extradiol MEMO1 family dioxygenase
MEFNTFLPDLDHCHGRSIIAARRRTLQNPSKEPQSDEEGHFCSPVVTMLLNGRQIVDCRKILPMCLMATAADGRKDLAEFNLKLAKNLNMDKF